MKTPFLILWLVGFMTISVAKRNYVQAAELKSDTTIRLTNHNNIKVVFDRPMTPSQVNRWKKDSAYFVVGAIVFRVIGDTAWKQ